MQKCKNCGVEKSDDEFYRKTTTQRRERMCKQCWSKRQHNWYINQKDRSKAARKSAIENGTSFVCRDCKSTFPAADFHKSASNKNGCSTRCKVCHAKYAKRNKFKFSRAKSITSLRDIRWCLSIDEYNSLVLGKRCVYCGGSLPEYGHGLDRKDNALGYTVSNCVACCAICNRVKSDVFTHAEMIRLGSLIQDIMEKRKLKEEAVA